MRWPLHYQILAATVLGAVVGLVFNPGSSTLGDVRYEQSEAGVLVEVEAGPPSQRLLDVAVAGDPNLEQATSGVVSDRSVRFRFETEGVHAVYSRTYHVDDRRVPMISRLVLGPAAEVEASHGWLWSSLEEYRSSLGRWLDDIARWIGDLFLRLLKMVTVPLIVTSLVSAVAGLGGRGRLGGLFGGTLLYYLATSVLAITTGLVLVNLIGPGVGAELPGASREVVGGEGESLAGIFGGLVDKLVPTNPLGALANGEFLSIISFSILFGVFLGRVKGPAGATLVSFFDGAFEVMMGLTQWVIRLAPIGVAAFMLSATVSQGIEVFATLGWYLLTVFLALLVHAVVVLPLVLRFVARRDPLEYARAMSPALLTAFSTASSNGTLPLTMSSVEERAGVPRRVGAFVLPLGATINMDGTALYEAVAVLFIAQATPGFELGLGAQVAVALTALLASVGAAGIPHAGLVMMAIVLQAVGLPMEAQGLILAVDRVLDMCRTSVNVWSDACGCAVVARFSGDELPENE
jgi:proton glutamate symport protein